LEEQVEEDEGERKKKRALSEADARDDCETKKMRSPPAVSNAPVPPSCAVQELERTHIRASKGAVVSGAPPTRPEGERKMTTTRRRRGRGKKKLSLIDQAAAAAAKSTPPLRAALGAVDADSSVPE
jgi:hypothetical protein